MIPKPYLIFVGDVPWSRALKTAKGLADWCRDDCVGQWRLSEAAGNLGLPDMVPAAAAAAGARSLVIGVSPLGGGLTPTWIPALTTALEAGLDLVSGLHQRLNDIAILRETADRLGRRLFDVRHNDREFPLASGRKRSGRRLLTVGTDCALGKKYTALTLTRAMRAAGISADFRATGQTGIMIAGDGVAIDSVVVDFAAGAAETLSPSADDDHWDVIEGQGALLHPSYAGVTLALLHGSQPDLLVLCHDPTRSDLDEYPGFPVRPLAEVISLYVSLAKVTNPQARCGAISLNTGAFEEAEARAMANSVSVEHGIPCFDPMRFGVAEAVSALFK